MTAPSLTISTTQNGTLSLSPSDNPVLITGAGAIAATVAGAGAIDRAAVFRVKRLEGATACDP